MYQQDHKEAVLQNLTEKTMFKLIIKFFPHKVSTENAM